MSLWLGGVARVRKMGSQWIIFYSIVRLPMLFGILSSAMYGWLGLYLVGW
jgi:hypothetical protein